MDANSAILISDSDSDDNENITRGSMKVHPFISVLPKDPTDDKNDSLPTTSTDNLGVSTAPFISTTEQCNGTKCVNKNVAVKKITVKDFAKETPSVVPEKLTQQSLIYVNKQPVIQTPGTFINIATTKNIYSSPLNNTKPAFALNSQPNNPNAVQTKNAAVITKIRKSNVDKSKSVMNPPVIAKHLAPQNVELKTCIENEVPIKIVDINTILQKAHVQFSKNETNVSKKKMPGSSKLLSMKVSDSQQKLSNNTDLGTVQLNSTNLLVNQPNACLNKQQIMIQTPDLPGQNNENPNQLPESLSAILKSLPPLRNAQNIYLIKLPNNTQLALNYIPQGSVIQSTKNQVSNVEKKLNTTKTLNHVKIEETPSCSNSNNDTSEDCTILPQKEKAPKKCVTAHRCLELKKSSFKIDIEGFTFFDRLGFFKAEEKRAKRCANIAIHHIKVRELVINMLENKRALKLEQRNESLYKSRMEKLVEKCNNENQQNQTKVVTSHKVVRNSIQHVQKRQVVLQKKKNIINKRKRKHVQKHNEKYTTSYNLKELRIVLSRAEVAQYFNKKKSQNLNQKQSQNLNHKKSQNLNHKKSQKLVHKKSNNPKCSTTKDVECEVSKRKITVLYDKCITLDDLLVNKPNNTITFIDENYFELIEQLQFRGNQMYFINKHTVITALYMDFFPLFRKAVLSDTVKIVDKSVFEKYMSLPSSAENSSIKTYCDFNQDTENKQKNNTKRIEFCKFVTDFHLMRKYAQQQSMMVLLEHNYAIKNKV